MSQPFSERAALAARAASAADTVTAADSSPFLVVRARAASVQQLSPSFRRVVFAAAELRDAANPAHTFDQRIKLIFPPESGMLPDLGAAGDHWYQTWLQLPETERGAMRTYTIRQVAVADTGATTLAIDFALHFGDDAIGPASRWASTASVGDELLIIAPKRGRFDGGGIEFFPGSAQSILLAGDETAAPAIASILEDCASHTQGTAFIEVPHSADCLSINAPAGVTVHWLPRDGSVHGQRLIAAVLAHLKTEATRITITDVDTEDPLWETPSFSRLNETLEQALPAPSDCWYWIAGESGVVTTLRRTLVRDLQIARTSIAFMGYWRHGVAMRG